MTQPFSSVSVVGLGTVGSALALLIARSGARVVAVEADGPALEAALGRMAGLAAGEDRTSDSGLRPAVFDRITFTTQATRVADTDLVIEALPENTRLKTSLLRQTDALCAPDTIFATTTSVSVAPIAAGSGRMARTVGLHPVGLRTGLPHQGAVCPEGGRPTRAGAFEVVTTAVTEPRVRTVMAEFVRSIEHIPITMGDRPGFAATALLMGYLNSALTMYAQRYASRDDIDKAMRFGCGLPLGPLAHLDAIGLDTAQATLEGLYELTGDRQYVPDPVLTRMVTAGLLGRKSGRGFYHYADNRSTSVGSVDAEPVPDLTLASDVRRDRCDAERTRALSSDGRTRVIRRVGVIGSGTMATGIAEVFARAGYPTVVVARTDVKAKEALARVAKSLERGLRRGKLTAADLELAISRLTGSTKVEAVAECDLVVEAVVEELAVKRRVFSRLDAVCRPQALLATTTSSLPVVRCATATGRPEDVVGLHFFNPAPVMKLVEVVRTVVTADDVVNTAHQVCGTLGKHPVDCTDRAGFIVNALLFPYLNRAVRLVENNYATAEEIDTLVASGFGYPLGPLALQDVIGLDVSLNIQGSLHDAFKDPSLAPARCLEQLVEAGYLGRKSGRGFHVY